MRTGGLRGGRRGVARPRGMPGQFDATGGRIEVPLPGNRCRVGAAHRRNERLALNPRRAGMYRKSEDALRNHDPLLSSACRARARTRSTNGAQPAAPPLMNGHRPRNTHTSITGARCLIAKRMVARRSAPRDLGARCPALQRAAVVKVPGASFAERSASRRARPLSPLVQLLSNWGKPRGLR